MTGAGKKYSGEEANGRLTSPVVCWGSAGALRRHNIPRFPKVGGCPRQNRSRSASFAAMTGPSFPAADDRPSTRGRGFSSGRHHSTPAGGVQGRKLDVITRDTQGDPTQGPVNADAGKLISPGQGGTRSGDHSIPERRSRPHRSWARAKIPNIHPCVVGNA